MCNLSELIKISRKEAENICKEKQQSQVDVIDDIIQTYVKQFSKTLLKASPSCFMTCVDSDIYSS